MFIYQFHEGMESFRVAHFLQAFDSPKPKKHKKIFARIYRTDEGAWRLLGSLEVSPNDAHVYELTEYQYVEFLDHFQPDMIAEENYRELFLEAEAKARKEIIQAAKRILGTQRATIEAVPKSILGREVTEKNLLLYFRSILADRYQLAEKKARKSYHRRNYSLDIQDFNVDDLPIDLVQGIASLPEELHSKPEELHTFANLKLQDTILTLQQVGVPAGLKAAAAKTGSRLGASVATALASTSNIFGVLFGAVSGVAVAAGCGSLSATIYRKRAVKKFVEEYGRAPTKAEKKMIETDSKHLGYQVFGSMSGWCLGAAFMQGVLSIGRMAFGVTPAGILANSLVAVASGIGQAVGSCRAHHEYAKSKFMDEKTGQLDEMKWQAHKNSWGYKKQMCKLGAMSFVSGAAIGVANAFIPGGIMSFLGSTVSRGIKLAAKLVTTTFGAGFTVLTSFCFAAKVRSAVKKSQDKQAQLKEHRREYSQNMLHGLFKPASPVLANGVDDAIELESFMRSESA